jgi:hypothetical protein
MTPLNAIQQLDPALVVETGDGRACFLHPLGELPSLPCEPTQRQGNRQQECKSNRQILAIAKKSSATHDIHVG